MKKNANKGFSLVELIIVIAIMAVLIGVLAPQFIKQVEKSRESTDLQNLEETKTAIETYVAEYGESFTSSTADIVIEFKSNQINISGGPDDLITKLGEYGVENNKALKSTKWTGTCKATYDVDAYTWTMGSGSATYFNLDGTNV